MPLFLALAFPIFAACGYLLAGWTRSTRLLGAAAAAMVLIAGLNLVPPFLALRGLVAYGPLTDHALVLVGVVAVLVMAAWPRQLANEIHDHILGAVTARFYGVFAMIALAAAVIASAALGLLAAAAMTVLVVAVTGLVASRRKPAQVRAASGYAAANAVGLAAIATGALLPVGATATTVALLGWLVLAGAGGLHWWLPPTVTVASAPVSALIGGLQVPLALVGILRLDQPSATLLIGFGLASLLVAVVGLARQRDLRRLIAHLGIAGTGLALLALGLDVGRETRWALACLGLGATVLYLAAGHAVSLTGSGRLATMRGLLSRGHLLGQVIGVSLFSTAVLYPAIGFTRAARLTETSMTWLGPLIGLGLAAVAVLVAVGGWRILTGDAADRADLTSGPARPLGSAAGVLVLGAVATVVAAVLPS